MKPVLYLVMRIDLPSLNPGKLAAQAAHCANAAVAHARRQRSERKMLSDWETEGRDFGTTIVLGAPKAFIASLPIGTQVYDETYPCEIPTEIAEAIHGSQPRGGTEWFVEIGQRRSLLLRKELVGAFHFAVEKPEHLRGLELYP